MYKSIGSNYGGFNSQRTIKIGLLGLGNIGTGNLQTLEMNREEVESTLGAKVEIVKILPKKIPKETEA